MPTDGYRSFLPWKNDPSLLNTDAGPDDRSGAVYLHDPNLQLAAETAIVTQRPLLLRGEPGCGKSSFAPFAARNLRWRYYEKTISARTEARDLLWGFDALRRLRDAQAGKTQIESRRYVTPGVLWWAFNREDAQAFLKPAPTDASEPFAEVNTKRDPARAVVLIDEIDKAEPDLPNDLLEVLSLNRFTVTDAPHTVERKTLSVDPAKRMPESFGSFLLVITTNQERDLPPAFVRRCAVHTLAAPEDEEKQIVRLEEIAKLHMSKLIQENRQSAKMLRDVGQKYLETRRQPVGSGRRGPNIAEYLDAIRVCLRLGITPQSAVWKQIEENLFVK
jgi:MoxR-like ATPase